MTQNPEINNGEILNINSINVNPAPVREESVEPISSIKHLTEEIHNFPVNIPVENKLEASKFELPNIINAKNDQNPGKKGVRIFIFRYSNFDPDTDDISCCDKEITCFTLRCIGYTFIYTLADLVRLVYEIFVWIYVPFAIFLYNCFRKEIAEDSKSVIVRATTTAMCCIAFCNCMKRYLTCPWFFLWFIVDCIKDIMYRSFDHARRGCFQYHHEDCGGHFYENNIARFDKREVEKEKKARKEAEKQRLKDEIMARYTNSQGNIVIGGSKGAVISNEEKDILLKVQEVPHI